MSVGNEDNIDFKNVQGRCFKVDSTYYMLYSANNFKSSNYAKTQQVQVLGQQKVKKIL